MSTRGSDTTPPPVSPSKGSRNLVRMDSTTGLKTKTRRVRSFGDASVYLDGRPPWYTASGEAKEAFVIGVAGGTASGKTSVCKEIIRSLQLPWVVQLSHDSFYKSLEGENREKASRNDYNFDHPDAIDNSLCAETLRKLKQGHAVDVPIYDFASHTRTGSIRKYGADVIIFEGIMVFCDPELLELMDMKVFVDTDADIRLARRLRRDCAERGRDPIGVLEQYERFVKPGFDALIAPSMRHADVILPRGAENKAAIKMLMELVSDIFRSRGVQMRSTFANLALGSQLPRNLHTIKMNKQTKACLTIIRNKDTSREDFIFFMDRVSRLVLEEAVNLATDFEEVEVQTPTGGIFKGLRSTTKLVGCSIVRAGEAMEGPLKDISPVPVGKILIQQLHKRHHIMDEPKLFYYKLPDQITDGRHKVILMDPTLGSGAAAIMAVRVLLDHGVSEDHIVFATLVASAQGVQALSYVYPGLTIVAAEVDPELNEKCWICPGMGNVGNRYWGTE